MTVHLFPDLPPLSRRSAAAVLASVVAVFLPLAAGAQMQLPGAVAPAEEGSVAHPAAATPVKRGPPPPPKVPSDDTLLGRTLELNGRTGSLLFNKEGKELRLSKGTLPGEKISRPAESCTVDASGAALTPMPTRPDGVIRYSAAFPSCPVEFDVLEGAILVAPRAACEYASADCRVDPAGLWGQPASEIGAARSKEIERARAPAEQAMRNQFRAWIEASGKDHELVRKISRYQAAFSSNRAETCDRYAREAEHGYCSLTLTQARTAALAARIALPDEPPPEPLQGVGRRPRGK